MVKHCNFILGVVIAVGLVHAGKSQAPCNGRLCHDTEYCQNGSLCAPRKPLGSACTDLGQCLPAHSECLGEEFATRCQCLPVWTEGPDKTCIVGCPSGSCSRNFYCSKNYHGCLPQLGLHLPCDKSEENPLQCKNNTICSTVNETCICNPATSLEKDGVCIPKCTPSSMCRPEIEFCASTGECMMKKFLSQPCEHPDECMTMNSECGADNTCDCKNNFKNFMNTTCVPECFTNDICRTGEYCNLGEHYCVSRANLNGTCDKDNGSTNQCVDPNAACHQAEGTCLCAENFKEFNKQCVLACTSQDGCKPNEFCNVRDGICQTKHFLGEVCFDNNTSYECFDADNGTNVICKNGRCACSDDFSQSGNICIQKCSATNPICKPELEFCNIPTGDESGRCTPKIDLNGICRSQPQENPCKTNNAVCSETNRCSCVSTHVENSGNCILKCVDDSNCTQPNQFCSLTGACKMKFNLTEGCDSSETNQKQCSDANAECNNNFCLCRETHAEFNAMCVDRCVDSSTCGGMYCDKGGTPNICRPKSSLGQDCAYEDQCSNENALCELNGNKTCICSPAYYNYQNGICLPKCTREQGCPATDFCTEDNRCERKKPLGGGCSDGIQCKTPDAVCGSNNLCACPPSHWEDKTVCVAKCTESTVCDPEAQYCAMLNQKCYDKVGFNKICTPEDDSKDQCAGKLTFCSPIPSSNYQKCLCGENAEKDSASVGCTCAPAYVESQDVLKCLKTAVKIGDICDEVQQCYTLSPTPGENATLCNNKICSCTSQYVGNSLETKCLKKATNLLEPCEESIQCNDIGDGNTGAECSNQQCSCPTKTVPHGNKLRCVPVANNLQDSCEIDDQCALLGGIGFAASKCVENKCSCQAGYVDGSDKMTCRKVAENLDETCQEDLQCTNLGDQVECKESKCQCKSGFSPEDNKCVATKSGSGVLGPVPFVIFSAMIIKHFTF